MKNGINVIFTTFWQRRRNSRQKLPVFAQRWGWAIATPFALAFVAISAIQSLAQTPFTTESLAEKARLIKQGRIPEPSISTPPSPPSEGMIKKRPLSIAVPKNLQENIDDDDEPMPKTFIPAPRRQSQPLHNSSTGTPRWINLDDWLAEEAEIEEQSAKESLKKGKKISAPPLKKSPKKVAIEESILSEFAPVFPNERRTVLPELITRGSIDAHKTLGFVNTSPARTGHYTPALTTQQSDELKFSAKNPLPSTNIYPVGAPLKIADRAILGMNISPTEKLLEVVTGKQMGQIHRLSTGLLINPQAVAQESDLSKADRQWLAFQDRFSFPIKRTLTRPIQPNTLRELAVSHINFEPVTESSRNIARPLQPDGVDVAGRATPLPWVYALAFYPQGDRLVTGGSDGQLRVWRINEQRIQGVPINAHQGWIFTVTLDPLGRIIASAGNDGMIQFFSAETGETLFAPINAGGEIYALKFMPNGNQIFSSSQDGSIRLWDVQSGQMLGGLSGHTQPVYALALSPDGKTLASAGEDGSIRLWDAPQGKPLKTIDVGSGTIYGLAFNPGGNVLASAGKDSQVRVWSLPNGQPVPYVFYTKGASLLSVAFSPDGNQLIAGSFDHQIWQWNFSTATPTADSPLSGHRGWINSVAFHPSGSWFASASADGTVRQWRSHAPDAPLSTPSGKINPALVGTVTINNVDLPKDRVVHNPHTLDWAIAEQNTIFQLANSGGADASPPIHAPTTKITALNYSDDGALIMAGDNQGAFWIWTAKKGQMISQGQSHTGISQLRLSHDERWLIVGHDDGSLRLFYREASPSRADKKKTSTPTPENWIASPTWSSHPSHQGSVRSIIFLSPSVIASGGDDQHIVLQRLDNGDVIGSPFGGHFTPILALITTEQGRTLYSAGADGSLQKWEVSP